MSAGFKPTGQYGIGFFSVFMIGSHIKAVSRRYDAAMSETHVLEFIDGLESRPILRKANATERLLSGGAVVHVKLGNGLPVGWATVRVSRPAESFVADLCAWLCPASDVDITVIDEDYSARVVTANDW
ncbi:hypothetical protein [Kibdelosporangium phytohabitans]|uniref:hypothetical protein n=1 Tax=Kibdelosporangium phytohabitans TaxID=860235 RepID=UPI0012FCA156|nr:hypothetical protein [Kibdelosporangium phytohabitans]